MFLGLFALGDVDIDAYHPLRTSVVAIQNEAPSLNPADLTSTADDPVLKAVLTPLFTKSLGADLLDPFNILRVDSGVPFAARGDLGPLRQPVDGHVTLGDLHGIGVNIVRVATHEGCLAGEGQLQIALDQGMLCAFEVRDVTTDPQQSFALSVCGANKGTFDRDPSLVRVGRATGDRRKPIFGPDIVADPARGDESFIEVRYVLGMNEGPCVADRPGWTTGRISVDEAVAGIALKALRLEVNAPDAKLRGIKRELQPIVAIIDGGLIAASLGEERGKDQHAG